MAQIINDHEGKTLVAVSSKDKELQAALKKAVNKTEVSRLVGETIAQKAKKAKVVRVVLDRNGYPYHGRVKAFADAARKGGLEF
jgi:large subunit ribosomal protein L18